MKPHPFQVGDRVTWSSMGLRSRGLSEPGSVAVVTETGFVPQENDEPWVRLRWEADKRIDLVTRYAWAFELLERPYKSVLDDCYEEYQDALAMQDALKSTQSGV